MKEQIQQEINYELERENTLVAGKTEEVKEAIVSLGLLLFVIAF